MVKISDVCPMPKISDMSESRSSIGGASSEFGAIMQKSMSAKSDNGKAIGNSTEKSGGNAEDSAEKNTDASLQSGENAESAASMCMNMQIVPQIEQAVTVSDISPEIQNDVIECVGGISDVDSLAQIPNDTAYNANVDLSAEYGAVGEVVADVLADLPDSISDDWQIPDSGLYKGMDLSGQAEVKQTAVQNIALQAEQPNEQINEPIYELVSDKNAVLTSDYKSSAFTENEQPPPLTDNVQNGLKASDISDAAAKVPLNGDIESRPVVDMYNRKVYLDELPQESMENLIADVSDDTDISDTYRIADFKQGFDNVSGSAEFVGYADTADIYQNAELKPKFADAKADNVLQPAVEVNNIDTKAVVDSDGDGIQSVGRIGAAGGMNVKNTAESDIFDAESAVNVSSEAVSSYSGVITDSVENVVPFEEVSQTESVKNQIVDEIYSKFNAGETDFQIEIKPQELGTVTVKMAVKSAELVIELIAHDSRTQNIIISNSNEIKSILQSQLNQDVTVEVVPEENNAWHYDDSQSQNAQTQQQEAQQQKNEDDSNNNLTVDFVTLMQMLSKK